MLAKALVAAGGASAPAAAVAAALRRYEVERVGRAMPVTVKSHIMGAMLQIRNSWVTLRLPCLPNSVTSLHCLLASVRMAQPLDMLLSHPLVQRTRQS